VSLLPLFSKMFEKIVCIQLMEYLEENNLLGKHQSGFRKNHSTETALLHMIDSWTQSMAAKKCVGVVTIDLSKAFDCLTKTSILESLDRAGVRGTTLEWFDSYLSKRRHICSINGEKSESLEMLCGVPQGSILGPILFALTISDIESVVDTFLHAFADDTTISHPETEWAEMKKVLERQLRQLFVYFAFKGLKINLTKCHLILLNRKHLKNVPTGPVTLELFDKSVVEVDEITLLGLTFDANLNFESHIQKVYKKCVQNIKFLWRTSKDLSFEIRKLLGNAIVGSHLNYCSVVYHNHLTAAQCKKLDSVQYMLSRFLLQSQVGEHVSANYLRRKLKWVPLHDMRTERYNLLIWKMLGKTAPIYLLDLLNANSHSYPTRQICSSRSALVQSLHRKTVNYHFMNTYDRLPGYVKRAKSEDIFKRSLRKFTQNESFYFY
jgi:hypothetical protein